VARRIAALKTRAAAAGIATIYANDNFGRWRSDATSLVKDCSNPALPGADVVTLLAPGKDDYFVLKPRHSAFFASALEALLAYMGTQRLVIAGISSHQCVLFTANDAYVREYQLKIPRDCIAAPEASQSQFALRYFKMVLGADTRPSAQLGNWPRAPRRKGRRSFGSIPGRVSRS